MKQHYVYHTFDSDEEAVIPLNAEDVYEFESFWNETSDLYQQFQGNLVVVEFISLRHVKREELLARFSVEDNRCFLYMHRALKKRDVSGVMSFFVLMKKLVEMCHHHELLRPAVAS